MWIIFSGVSHSVYCGREWPTIFGDNFTAFSGSPLIYAHYDLTPSFSDTAGRVMYGGWAEASGKQFWDGQGGEKMCGTGAVTTLDSR